MDTCECVAVLELLARTTIDLTQDMVSHGSPPLPLETRMRMACTSFEYSELGIKAPLTGSTVHVPDVGRAVHAILLRIRHSMEWRAAARALKPLTKNKIELDHTLEVFCHRLMLPVLGRKDLKALSPRQAATAAVQAIGGQPVEYRASALLQGFLVLEKPLAFEVDQSRVNIRPTTAEDMTYDVPEFSLTERPHLFSRPTALLTAARPALGPNALQSLVSAVVSALRLFNLCSASIQTIRFDADAGTGLAGLGVVHTQRPRHTRYTCAIAAQDAERLEAFVPRLYPLLPRSATKRHHDDPISIALSRYEHSILDADTLDEQVLGATMALEAVLLGGDEKQELGFKLSCRAARLLASFGADPVAVKNCVKKAYQVRSRYVHGGVSTPKSKASLAKNYGTEDRFTREVLNTTRQVLVTTILAQQSKDAFLRTLDSALIASQPGSFDEKMHELEQWVRRP